MTDLSTPAVPMPTAALDTPAPKKDLAGQSETPETVLAETPSPVAERSRRSSSNDGFASPSPSQASSGLVGLAVLGDDQTLTPTVYTSGTSSSSKTESKLAKLLKAENVAMKKALEEHTTNYRKKTISFPFVFVEVIFALLLVLFLILNLIVHVHDSLLTPQIERLVWTETRESIESTYYSRLCTKDDISATDPKPLLLNPSNSTPQEAHDTFLEHGFVFFPQVLNDTLAEKAREYCLKKNLETDLHGGDNILHSPNHRWLIELGVHDDPVVKDVLKQIATHKLFRPSIDKILGNNAALVEFDVITSSPGAGYQSIHSDGRGEMSPMLAARSFSPTHVMLIQLQDTTVEMGATQVCPGTHYCHRGHFCVDETVFSVVNETGYWPAGGAVLMNTNSYHRGAAYLAKEGPHRVMMVLTFAPHPEPRAESRMLTQDLSYSLPWYMWGHTIDDMEHADDIMKWPWTELRGLGLLKHPRSKDWGIDFITLWLRRLANEYDSDARNEESLTAYLGSKRKDVAFLKWLHGGMPQQTSWFRFLAETMRLVMNLIWRVLVLSVPVYVFSWILYGLMMPPSRSQPRHREKIRQRARPILRLLVIYYSLNMSFRVAQIKIDKSDWARDIKNNLRNSPYFEKDANLHFLKGPVTFPSKRDILLESRFGSDFLGMYNEFTAFHPGNKDWRQLMMEHSNLITSLCRGTQNYQPSSCASPFLRTLAIQIVEEMMGKRRARFLYQNTGTGDWHILSEKCAIDQTIQELAKTSSRLLSLLLQKIRFLHSDCRYGFRRRTALCRIHSGPNLDRFTSRLLSNYDVVSPGKNAQGVNTRTQPVSIKIPSSSISKVAKLSTSNFVDLSRKKNDFVQQKTESEYFATVGDHVLVQFTGEGCFDGWVKEVKTSSMVLIHFRDGDELYIGNEYIYPIDVLRPGARLQVFDEGGRYSAFIDSVDLQSETMRYYFPGEEDFETIHFEELNSVQIVDIRFAREGEVFQGEEEFDIIHFF